MSVHFDPELKVVDVLEGGRAQFISGERLTVAKWHLQAGTIIPWHSHKHEQVVNVIQGTLEMLVDEDVSVVNEGESCVVAANREHSAVARTEVLCIDVFAPVREDYRAAMNS